MERVRLFAKAKINLALDVVERLDNGYHNLETIMQSIDIADVIEIKKTFTNDIKLQTNVYWLPIDNKNLVYKVAQYLKENYNIKYGIHINLIKRTPVGAGLGGGSADCATALVGIRKLFGLRISNSELLNISKNFGADVPFCLKRGTYLAEGIGERLTPIHKMPNCHILVAKPPISISTASIFESLDLSKIKERPDIEKIIYYMQKNNIEGVASNLCNVLEIVSIEKYPIIKDIKEVMLDNGALGSLMSGSGSAVFGIFQDNRQMAIAKKQIEYKLNIKETFNTKPFNPF